VRGVKPIDYNACRRKRSRNAEKLLEQKSLNLDEEEEANEDGEDDEE
jgi:hypothetical protein